MRSGHDAEVVLGVDIGTTSAKAVACDASGIVHGRAERAYPVRGPGPGHAVQDPLEVLDAVLRVAPEACPPGARVAGVALSGAMHSLVGLDGDGRPLTPLLTWADTRAAAQAERLREQRPELHARTGTPLHAMAPLA